MFNNDNNDLKQRMDKLESEWKVELTRLNLTLQSMEQRLSAQNDKLSIQIQSVDDKLSAQIKGVDDKLSAQIQDIDKRLGRTEVFFYSFFAVLISSILAGLVWPYLQTHNPFNSLW